MERIELKFVISHRKHFHERLTPEFPDHQLQNKGNQSPSEGRLAWRHYLLLCSHQPSHQLHDAKRKRLGSGSIFISSFSFHRTFSRCTPEELAQYILHLLGKMRFKCLISKLSRQSNYCEQHHLFLFQSDRVRCEV